jgi:hypothetical protein
MKFHLFNFKRSGAILVLAGCGCLGGFFGGILPAAELKPLAEDDTRTPILVGTNRAPLPSGKVSIPTKPNELNFREMLKPNIPLPAPTPRLREDTERKDEGDLLDQEKTWSFITPQDVLDDYMARHILKLPEYDKEGRKIGPKAALERFYQRLGRGDGSTNGGSLFGPKKQQQPDRIAGKTKDDDEDEDLNLVRTSARRDVFGDGVPDSDLDNGLFGRQTGISDSSSRSKQDFKDVSAAADRMRRMQKDHLDAVRKVWNFDAPVASATGLPDFNDDQPWLKSTPGAPANPSPSVIRPTQANPLASGFSVPTFDPLRSGAPSTPGLPGAAAPSVAAPPSAPSYGPPPPPPTRVRPVSQPFTIPQRKF